MKSCFVQLLARFVILAFTAFGLVPAQAAWNVDELMRQAHQAALDDSPLTRDERAEQVIRASFEKLLAAQGLRHQQATLRVVQSTETAKVVFGNIILAEQSLAECPEDERLFVLAHELGHVQLKHYDKNRRYVLSLMAGVTNARTAERRLEANLGKAARLSRQWELDADAYAHALAQKAGTSQAGGLLLFARNFDREESPTHPSAAERYAHLLKLMR